MGSLIEDDKVVVEGLCLFILWWILKMGCDSLVRMMGMVLVVLGLFGAAVRPSEAMVYKVGGDIGWTSLNSPNYTAWAAGKTFYVGDTLLFEYNKMYHNVMQISKAEYMACTSTKPIATYTSGSDSIPITATGRHYYFCGIPGHCLGGQKVEIPVVSGHRSKAKAAPAPAPVLMEPMMPMAPVPKPSAGTSIRVGTLAVVGVVAFFAFFAGL